MAQFGRPSTDTVNEGYLNEAASGSNLFQSIDETVASDTDYIQSAAAPTSDVYATKLTTLEDPVSSSGHIIRYRHAKSASGGAQIDLTVQLRQGYVSEGTPGTLIKAWTHTNISNTATTESQTLSGAEADAITNYNDLFLRFVFNQV